MGRTSKASKKAQNCNPLDPTIQRRIGLHLYANDLDRDDIGLKTQGICSGDGSE